MHYSHPHLLTLQFDLLAIDNNHTLITDDSCKIYNPCSAHKYWQSIYITSHWASNTTNLINILDVLQTAPPFLKIAQYSSVIQWSSNDMDAFTFSTTFTKIKLRQNMHFYLNKYNTVLMIHVILKILISNKWQIIRNRFEHMARHTNMKYSIKYEYILTHNPFYLHIQLSHNLLQQ